MTQISNIGLNAGNSVLSTRSANYGDNPFLSLLVTQMRSQTPLDPVDNQSFMEQIATFSSMEEQKQLNDNMLKLLDFQGVLARLQGLSEGSALLGKVVSYDDSNGNQAKGQVDSVFVNDSGDVILRMGENEVSMRRVTGIEEPKSDADKKSDSEKKDDKKSDSEKKDA